jgi:hypothetical protein
MQVQSRSRITSGILLILLGLLLLSYQMMPVWWTWLRLEYSWPLAVIGLGLFLLILALLARAPALVVPGCVIAGIGGILYWQNATGNWGSWSYMWTLIPGFIGVGIILAGLMSGTKVLQSVLSGAWTILTSLILFAAFGFVLGGLNIFGVYWPVLLIAAGLLVFLRALIRR